MHEPAAPADAVGGCDSVALLWRSADLRAARRRGLVGALVGSLARAPRQNSKLGRPLLLLPEEEEVLRRSAAGCDVTSASHPALSRQDVPAAERRQQVALYEAEQRRSHQQQQALALQDRKSCLTRAMWSAEPQAPVWSAPSGPAPPDRATAEDLQRRLTALEQDFVFPRSAMAVQLSTARAGLTHRPLSRLPSQTPGPGRAPPDARLRVFQDLRERGFFLTSAGKFGGDFLVYPGDPVRFHAHFIAVCQPLEQSVRLLDLLAVARLGSNVKKTVLLCSPGADGLVVYTSLQWSGMV
ncbi:tRNA-splicing endonuclease subunit Sen34 [Synchiropus splendidus]|uniref:tRNA-splicing endonuclease subunit Sen34 n=1 Tax=Synchiropus splendidus TaxID=270530 RepID=UPI00237E3D03|nr:tRNA-splicing endonuclease subunit Sen34 [Synchiropus splendidus]